MRVKKVLAAAIIFFLTIPAYSKSSRNILLLNSYHEGMQWTDSIVKSVKQEFESSGLEYELFIEYMDTKRFPAVKSGHLDNLSSLYLAKYSNSAPDIIITSDDDAFQFMLSKGKRIFPGTPFVFCGVNHFDYKMVENLNNVTGVVERTDPEQSIDLILNMFPETKTIFFITDLSSTGIKNRERIERAREHYSERVSFEYADPDNNGMTLSELKRKLLILDKETVVYLVDFFFTSEGFIDPTFMVKEVTSASPVPVISHNGADLGKGIVGGKLNSGNEQGRVASEIAITILKGKRVSSIPIITENISSFMFDYPAMERFNISTWRLPNNSIVINEPESIYHKYRHYLYTALLIISLLLAGNIIQSYILKRKNLKLIESEKRFKIISENSPGVVFMFKNDEKKSVTYINSRIQELTGIDKDDFLSGKSFIKDFILDTEAAKEALDNSIKSGQPFSLSLRIIAKDGTVKWADIMGNFLSIKKGTPENIIGLIIDITEKKLLEEEKERIIADLKQALQDVKTLRGLVPICANCKKVRNDTGYWEQVESFVARNSEAQFSHGLCNDCAKKLYGESEWFDEIEKKNEI